MFFFLVVVKLKTEMQNKKHHEPQSEMRLFLISRLRPELGIVSWKLKGVESFSEQSESGQSPRWKGEEVPPTAKPGGARVSLNTELLLSMAL